MPPTTTTPEQDLRAALFLDFDGTLVDIAPRPEAVTVPPGLVPALQRVQALLGGAVALVSGRPIADLDRFLSPLRLPAAGVHGAERRRADGVTERPEWPSVEPIAKVCDEVAARHPGLRVERKGMSVALHYRQAPQFEALCIATMQEAVGQRPGFMLLYGKMVIEVLPQGAGKGRAVESFMQEPPFAGRKPVFIGDDVTDEAGFAAVQRAGGQAVKVGLGESVAELQLASPTAVREWLAGWQTQAA